MADDIRFDRNSKLLFAGMAVLFFTSLTTMYVRYMLLEDFTIFFTEETIAAYPFLVEHKNAEALSDNDS